MALSEHEQRLLDQLEQQLHADDPKFAHSMASESRTSMSTRRLVIGSLITIAGILVLLAGIVYQNIFIGVAGFLVMGAGVYFATTKSKQAVSGEPAGKPSKATAAGKSGFMSSLENKWDERKRDQT
ncbi:DUF3040 domain-containing protein [Arthrobacter agilis]|uniref:DUF3040 domain-containing protein n=1 Tax=Arthrobacter agilis TaxID=37921 RepID=UPI000B35B053|nr:DUF3040 domain-containing protein [Arthrobacter agilis]OUM45383.1 hypothetical protein B8W74_00930 [Arthrobacter agilis]PPB46988.1 DUF3040 domain-containing protein [Arthrobacter agilis]TPV23416.1 DUF3040 domain-containing protein [Arthrobacter agilis]VDR31797.1 Protein of uncharacterised function (DUF3040) [Arthrobacter agilis]